ncbi:hypothetical protein Fmac_001432 [Flemingia macrophylla]|uniref:Uncharacterized protein n=1 Tax=Flemingia macrophylla TaxID=520843 RepID=A0ABD1NIC0_9FABA
MGKLQALIWYIKTKKGEIVGSTRCCLLKNNFDFDFLPRLILYCIYLFIFDRIRLRSNLAPLSGTIDFCQRLLYQLELALFYFEAINGIEDHIQILIVIDALTLLISTKKVIECMPGDMVKVVGFYNKSPKLNFVHRRKLILTLNTDKNTEKDHNRRSRNEKHNQKHNPNSTRGGALVATSGRRDNHRLGTENQKREVKRETRKDPKQHMHSSLVLKSLTGVIQAKNHHPSSDSCRGTPSPVLAWHTVDRSRRLPYPHSPRTAGEERERGMVPAKGTPTIKCLKIGTDASKLLTRLVKGEIEASIVLEKIDNLASRHWESVPDDLTSSPICVLVFDSAEWRSKNYEPAGTDEASGIQQ